MYTPEWFELIDPELIQTVMREHPFATLVSSVNGEPFATHAPLVIGQSVPLVLCGHIARQNPQVGCFDGKVRVLAVFHGSHAYVSPLEYVTSPNVPTWNYVTVHATGVATEITDPEEAIEHLRFLVETFDPGLDSKQPESMDRSFWLPKLQGITAFRLEVDRLEAKGKLSQNRPERDQVSVTEAMAKSEIKEVQAVAKWMARVQSEQK